MRSATKFILGFTLAIVIGAGAWLATSRAGGLVGVQWTQVGPAPLLIGNAEKGYQGVGPDSGEVQDIAIDPRGTTDQIIYIATEEGGIWQSTDGGSTWKTTSDFLNSLSMGAVALDAANPSIVYAGTGNAGQQGFFKGVGVYKSSDAGQTWTLTPGSVTLNGLGIQRMASPAANVLVVGTDPGDQCRGDSYPPDNGVYWSKDGGGSFTLTLPAVSGANSDCHNVGISDLHLDTTAANTVLAAVKSEGIFVSSDGGKTWGPNLWTTSNGSPLDSSLTNFTPGTITFSQSTELNDHTIYASVQNVNKSAPLPGWGLFVSTDSGAHWAQQTASGNPSDNCSQCGYDQTIGVDPQDTTRVYLGFVNMWVSTDSGNSFTEIGNGQVHNDHHALVFSPPSHISGSPTTFYDGHDGGIDTSRDGGSTFCNINGLNDPNNSCAANSAAQGIATNLFRGIDIGRGSAANNAFTYGGMQDTGLAAGQAPNVFWNEGRDGDGGHAAVACNPHDAVNADDGGLMYTTDGGVTWQYSTVPGGATGGGAFAIDQTCDNIMYAAAAIPQPSPSPAINAILVSTDNGATYSDMHHFAQSVNAIGTVKIDPNTVWVGFNDGTLRFTTNALKGSSATWTAATTPGPGQAVSAVAIDAYNTSTIVATYEGFCGSCPLGSAHVFMSTNGGTSWNDISGVAGTTGGLPDLPVHSVVIDSTTNPHTIIVANDAGVLQTADQGASWQVLGLGMPAVEVVSLALDSTVTPEVLRAGTFGRSVFELGAATGPLLTINTNLSFGNVCAGLKPTQTVQLFNVGPTNLHISSFIRISGSPDFSRTSGPATPVTVTPGEEIDYTIRFAPSDGPGPETATFQINSDDEFQPTQQLVFTATVDSPAITTSGSTTFGSVCAGNNAQQTVTVGNVGKCDLHVTGASISCLDFTIENNPFPNTISHDSSLPLTIAFTPTSDGPKSCTLTITSDDPSNPSVTLILTATTPLAAGIDVPPDQSFPATVIQSVAVGACNSHVAFPISDDGICPLTIKSVAIGGANASDYTLSGLPSLPTSLQSGDILGGGDLDLLFKPSALSRARHGSLTVTYESDPVTHATTAVTRNLCGEGARTGVRVLVTVSGVPIANVNRIELYPVGGTHFPEDTKFNLRLQTVSQTAPCASFQFHREWGGVSNPTPLAVGNYELVVQVVVNGKLLRQTVNFTVRSCDFMQNIVVKF